VLKLFARLVAIFALTSAVGLSAAPALNKADLDAWLDGFMANAMRVNAVEGAVVVVVKDGKVLTQKGYGYADAAKRTLVDPENTMFRPGSISKLFTWTAIMQLSEQGKIDLDADINRYLDFKVVGKGGAKITIRNLMTHRAGFEEYGKSGIFSDPAALRPFALWIKSYTPERIFAPGSTPAYSNYGAALAGYIVQRVSGMPFETYVERNIFAPIGMTHSSFRQPLPKPLQPFMSKGYDLAGGDAEPFEILNDRPAGALSASGGDMARFMIAQLAAERAGDGKLFKPETARLMHRAVIKNFPQFNGMALGFYQANTNGHTVIAHGGDLQWFHSDLSLFIDDDIGIYIAMNSAGTDRLDVRVELLQQFADRYMPKAQDAARVDLRSAQLHAEQVSGGYIVARRLESSFARLGNLLGEYQLSIGPNGALLFKGIGMDKRFAEVSPYVWHEINGPEMLAVTMKDGKPLAMTINSAAPTDQFEPVPAWRSASLIKPAFVAALAVLVLTLLAWPVGALVRRYYGVASIADRNQLQILRVQRIGSFALIGSFIAWLFLIIPRASSGFFDADDTQILVTQAISIASVLIAVICMFWVSRLVSKTKRTRLAVARTCVWLLASLMMEGFYYNFNLLKIGAAL
jgi:CubicO group peptidase (beta-lactamase class C family)